MFDRIYDFSYIYLMDSKTFFSALSNEIRLRCLLLMQHEGELCVCELTYALGLTQPMISRHLAVLKDGNLVSDRREGQWIYYQVNPKLASWIQSVLLTTAEANRGSYPFKDDLDTLCEMPNRPNKSCCA